MSERWWIIQGLKPLFIQYQWPKLGQKGWHGHLHVKSSFYIKCHNKTLNQVVNMTSCPFRVTLGPFRATLASWSKLLGLLGPQDPATCATWHTTASKASKMLGDVMGLPRPTSWWKGKYSLGLGLLGCPWWNALLSLWWKPLIYLCPCLGSQHPSCGILSLWRSEIIISPYVPICRAWSCNNKKYALHGLICHRYHRMSITSNNQVI